MEWKDWRQVDMRSRVIMVIVLGGSIVYCLSSWLEVSVGVVSESVNQIGQSRSVQ